MDALRLALPTQATEAAYWDFIEEWQQQGERIVPFAVSPRGYGYAQWLAHQRAARSADTCAAGWVPSHLYLLLRGDTIVGAIDIRHYLNDHLLMSGGHIGYGVRPTARRRGYATAMLALALPLARALSIDRALITCDDTNVGSARTIEKNGGVLENKIEDEGKLIRRYWITLV
ncbi:MAG: GNAT family N-acetyltransferase [Eubacteriales bacterium]|nr:GNAT family N-acetyltransferase [Eubacteriales bacterium]